MPTASAHLIDCFALEDTSPPVFFASCEQIDANASRHPYSHLMRRAWESMNLSGIFCVDRKPTIYFKEVNRIDARGIRKIHRRLWNQGIATLLVIISPEEVHVYSGLAYPAREQDDVSGDNRLVDVLNRTADALELRRFIQKVETGQLYRDYQGSFKPERSVDQYLLENLRMARDLLHDSGEGLEYQAVHALLGRIIFTSYLRDRDIINGTQFADAGANDVDCLRDLFNNYSANEAKNILYNLFELLQGYFNGSMFDEAIMDERHKICEEHIEILKKFLNGEKLSSGQRAFGFWIYDFSVIPIETISAIYEDFLSAESSQDQRSSGAYYTPKHLAEMVVDVAINGWNSLIGKKYLDPACGSGIFLVILFNRIAEEWRFKNPRARNITRAKALIEILQTHLYGVDINETACRITCFSLYLALLDQLKPRDIHELKERHNKVLPKLLARKENHFNAVKSPVIFQGSFFDQKLPLPSSFDLVIGNPPWIGRGQSSDPKALHWCLNERNPFFNKAPKGKQARKSFFMPQNQMAHAFMWKAPLHLHKNGYVCLLLPSKVFLNRTNTFQEGWFANFMVERIVQLSDMRFILFEHALCPAVITKYRHVKPPEENYQFEYIVPKANRDDPRKGTITIFPEDRKRMTLSDVILHAKMKETPILWKKSFWGTPRDVELVNRLLSLPSLNDIVGKAKKPKRWIRGQGFQPFYEEGYHRDPKNYRNPKPIWWTGDHLFLEAKNYKFDMILLESDCMKVGNKFSKLRRSPDPQLFIPPMVIVNQGFSRIAYCEFPVLFQDALQSISGPPEDKNLLKFLAAVLNSQLAIYFLFHISANWGTERDKVHLFELMRMPFPLPEETHNPLRSKDIIIKVAGHIDDLMNAVHKGLLGRGNIIKETQEAIEPLLYDYYEVSEREKILIEDTNKIFEPSSTPASLTIPIPTLRRSSNKDRVDYVESLCKVLNTWAKRGQIRVSGETRLSTSIGLGIVSLQKGERVKPYSESSAIDKFESALERIKQALPEQVGRTIYFRGLKIFEENQLHIIKPLELRHWTRTAALNDADELAASILSTSRID